MTCNSPPQTDLLKKTRRWLERTRQQLAPGERAWRGAGWGALSVLALVLLTAAYGLFGQAGAGWFLLGVLLFAALFALAGGLLTLVWRALKALPTFYFWVLICLVLVLLQMTLTALSVSIGIFAAGLGMLVLASLAGAGIAALGSPNRARLAGPQKFMAAAGLTVGVLGLAAGMLWLLDPGSPRLQVPDASALAPARIEALELGDPSQPGVYGVQTLTYGSGHDQQRPEYGHQADLITGTVDGSRLVERWSPLRRAYWGFGPEALPLNGRVWYPQGEGAFPLVVFVHGQHPMEDYSEAGYAYLGELLASRGYIVVSVDQNFLNLSPWADLLVLQSLVGVDDLRGWLLLEHLQVWRGWNETPGSPFYQQVDLDKVALAGHSRGGQAVAVASLFNKLPYHPDDATIEFDYGFNIRSLVAFAPVDGGYQPAGQPISLEDINYLVLHGAHDMDVFTFQGDRQYARVAYENDSAGFKAAVYIYGANHGQFNTSWGRKDLFEPLMRVFNLQQLLPAEQQQQVAQVLMSAFLEATLGGETGYQALFQDLRRGQGWLPDTIYLHQYQDAQTRLVGTFEEDLNLSTTTLPGGSLRGENLTLWREQPAQAKWETLGDQTVYLGWAAGERAGTARYTLALPDSELLLDEDSRLVFALADAGLDPSPEGGERRIRVQEPIDLTVELVDDAGQQARLPLSHFSLLQPQLRAQLGKAAFMSPLPDSEAVLQHFELRLGDFSAANPDFAADRLAEVRLVFDRTESGVIVLDNLGFR